MDFDGFNWDAGNCDKCQEHGVSIAEIEDIFSRDISVGPDVRHSAQEERFKAIGSTRQGRKVFVAFTLRTQGGDILVRPISARYMHAKEIGYYEETAAKPEN